jgi:hypothetical protein
MNYRIPFLLATITCIILAFLLEDISKKLENINPKNIQVDSAQVVAQRQRILQLEEAMRLGLIEKTHLIDKITQQSKIQAKTIIVEKKIPIRTEKVIIIDSSNEMQEDTNFYVKVPLDIIARDSWFTLIGRVDTSSFHLDTLAVLNRLSISVGEKKGKWWQKNEPLVEVKSANPHTKVEIENVTIEQKRKFWQKPLFGALIGAIGMFLLL